MNTPILCSYIGGRSIDNPALPLVDNIEPATGKVLCRVQQAGDVGNMSRLSCSVYAFKGDEFALCHTSNVLIDSVPALFLPCGVTLVFVDGTVMFIQRARKLAAAVAARDEV